MTEDISPLVPPGRLLLDMKVPMRDGENLSADVWLPHVGDGPWPALLLRTIYDNQEARYIRWARGFTTAGYAVVMQDCRGRGDSDGQWDPYMCELNDGFDTHEWVGDQLWCDGQVGTFGLSYPGFTQSLPATLRSEYLKAIAPIASQQDNYGHHRIDGVIHLAVALTFLNMLGRSMQSESLKHLDQHALFRHLPLDKTMEPVTNTHPYYRGVLEHEAYDEWWSRYSMRDRYGDVAVPSMFVTGWYDSLLHENFKLFNGWTRHAQTAEARERTKLIVGPWSHQVSPWGRVPMGPNGAYQDREFGDGALWDIVEVHTRWYDQRLKGIDTGIDDEPSINLFVMGANTWRFESEWPLARTQWTRFYLASDSEAAANGGRLNVEGPGGSGKSDTDSFTYNPADPVPSWGAQYQSFDLCGPRDRRAIEKRPDVLVYDSEPLQEELEITGPVSAVIYLVTTGADTDLTAALVDVEPDGKAIILCEGICRGRYRDGTDQPKLMEPSEIYELHIDMWDTSNQFKAGHCIRLEVSSSNFPRYDRNLNTGNSTTSDAEIKIAKQTVYHDNDRPSHVLLPVIST